MPQVLAPRLERFRGIADLFPKPGQRLAYTVRVEIGQTRPRECLTKDFADWLRAAPVRPFQSSGFKLVCLVDGRKNSAQLFLSLHVFADRLGAAPIGNMQLGNLLRMPLVGHLRAALFQRPVLFSPAFMPRLRLQLPRLAARIARGIATIASGSRIHQLPDCLAVYGKAICAKMM